MVKNPRASAGDPGSIPELGRVPGGGPGNLLQHSCLENPMDRGPSGATVPSIARSRTRLKQLYTHTYVVTICLIVLGTTKLFPQLLYHFEFRRASYDCSYCSTCIFVITWCCHMPGFGCCNKYVVVCQYYLNLCFCK